MTTQQATDVRPDPVTVIGLGPMGTALAEAFLDKGHSLTVWNRTPEKADGLVAKGAVRARTVAEAVAASPVTLVCLKDYEAMYEVLQPAAAVLEGRALVNVNSGTPSEARAAVGWCEERGIDYLDGAVMVPPPLVGGPGAVFLYSGSRSVFDRHHRTLTSLGDPRHLGEDAGLAVLHNAALLDMMYTTINGYLHATALVASAGISARTFAELAFGWFMPTVVGYGSLGEQALSLDTADYPGALGTLEMNLTALEHITRTSEEQHVSSEHPRLMEETARRAVAGGYGGQNYFAVYELLKKAVPDS
ncbi:6-phosphogluconate dehydrogenase [Streptomyces sp. CB02923]|uniref:NAD(P)-dependent oxidoreductase n=1 Tax=Streptomyces sp. CB02923 TaxID=1718985 RepID=UPI00093E7054|nr:NAD(P)-binding domain-containing protein [Streptomyces sp. CB02923]OKI02444.1 6-phosphogluconate dehydrogenase [Streptomyces sp. CB02923]